MMYCGAFAGNAAEPFGAVAIAIPSPDDRNDELGRQPS